MTTPRRALDGVKVLEIASFIAGPATATAMSDFGAEVVKVEDPEGGDPYRAFFRLPPMPASEANYCWLLDARNKKSVALDVTRAEARPVLLALVRWADVFLTNMPVGSQRRLGLAWEDLEPVNPRLIHAAMTGYGEVGPEANRPGYDINCWWARSGLVDVVRGTSPPPNGYPPGMGDHMGAMVLFGAIMMALYQRERSGRGAKVSTSLLANGAWSNSVLIQAALCGAAFLERRPREQAYNACINLYRARDGRWFNLTLLREDKDWPNLARAIGRPDLLTDPRFATGAARHAHSTALVQILDEVFATRDWAEWVRILAAHRVPCGALHRVDEAAADEQMAAIEALAPLEDAGIPGLRTVMSPIQIAGQPRVPPRPAPALGAHTEEVLRGLGYDPAAIHRLRAQGVIG